jgi:hypothetical protein
VGTPPAETSREFFAKVLAVFTLRCSDSFGTVDLMSVVDAKNAVRELPFGMDDVLMVNKWLMLSGCFDKCVLIQPYVVDGLLWLWRVAPPFDPVIRDALWLFLDRAQKCDRNTPDVRARVREALVGQAPAPVPDAPVPVRRSAWYMSRGVKWVLVVIVCLNVVGWAMFLLMWRADH